MSMYYWRRMESKDFETFHTLQMLTNVFECWSLLLAKADK